MPNPFPGVNPHIEATGDLWMGFHNAMITFINVQLNELLNPRGYAAVIDKRFDLIDVSFDQEQRLPDVAVTRPRHWSDAGEGGTGTAVLDVEPTTIDLPRYESVAVAFIEVRHLPGQRLVTGIELLSPTNKAGPGRGEYDAKRASILSTDVNLVEIDLLLGGRRLDMAGPIPAGDFCAFVSRGDRRPKSEVYAWSIRSSIPRLPVPLRPGDEDVTLDLPGAYLKAYNGGAYDLLLPYDRPLPGRLSDADGAWVAERVAEAHRRPA